MQQQYAKSGQIGMSMVRAAHRFFPAAHELGKGSYYVHMHTDPMTGTGDVLTVLIWEESVMLCQLDLVVIRFAYDIDTVALLG